ncbi:hypothetical protein L484_002518 [Morus notabilis]|uniref:ATP-dependent RNA helicase SUV3 DEXQ-box helicase domain-containing protein n=1 Tax=Morus notabilis TaxID=981085 RepID=W9R3H5_9ROSA|nr:hypothetical protein L484_002518 [Morus notabilis]
MYCAPLRLLAWEVAKRLNKVKVPCDLLTGQEREEIEGANMFQMLFLDTGPMSRPKLTNLSNPSLPEVTQRDTSL